MEFNTRDSWRSRRPGRLRFRLPVTERLFHRSFHVRRLHIAENRQHTIVRRGELLVEGFQIRHGDFLDGLLAAERIEAVAMLAEQGPPHGQAGALEQFILAGANAGDLDFLFALQFVGGKNRVQQDVCNQIQAGRKIAAQDLGIHPETVVAAVTVHMAADRFNFRREGLRVAPLACL